MICSICESPIEVQASGWARGHNAEPVNSGRCCSVCNDFMVIPARIARLYSRPVMTSRKPTKQELAE